MTRSRKSQKTAAKRVVEAIAPFLKAGFDPIAKQPLSNDLRALLIRSESKESEERIKRRVERLRRNLRNEPEPKSK